MIFNRDLFSVNMAIDLFVCNVFTLLLPIAHVQLAGLANNLDSLQLRKSKIDQSQKMLVENDQLC